MLADSLYFLNVVFGSVCKNFALGTVEQTPAKWLRYLDDTFLGLATWTSKIAEFLSPLHQP
jgi:hypothetical protein